MDQLSGDQQLAFQVAYAESRQRADPLRYWRPSSWAQRALISCWTEFKGDLDEVYWHAANSGGKTNACAALAVALLRGRKSLAGISLPPMPDNVMGVLLVHSYKQAVLSSVLALRQMLGDWPTHEVPASDDCPGVIYVKPEGSRSDDRSTWNRLYIFPRDGEVPAGLRLAFAWADEPPDEEMWRELRYRATRGYRFIRFIGATPKHRRYWRWLLEDFELRCGREPGREATWRETVNRGRLRIQSSIYDNRALTPGDIARAERDAEGDPEARARLFGDHIDSSGSNPWPPEILARWRARCREPEIEMVEFQAEVDAGAGKRLEQRLARLEVFERFGRLDSYYIPLDPARGIRDGRHDPDCLHVWSIRHNRLVARFNEYVGGFGLGQLAAIVAREYGNALVDVETNGGYGDAVLTGLRVAGYGNINRQDYWDRVEHKWASRLGFNNDEEFRGQMVGAIDRALRTDSCEIPSLAVVLSLMGCVKDERGKILADDGNHDEDLILAGRAQLFIGSGAGQRAAIAEPKKLDFNEALNRSMGRHVSLAPHEIPIREDW